MHIHRTKNTIQLGQTVTIGTLVHRSISQAHRLISFSNFPFQVSLFQRFGFGHLYFSLSGEDVVFHIPLNSLKYYCLALSKDMWQPVAGHSQFRILHEHIFVKILTINVVKYWIVFFIRIQNLYSSTGNFINSEKWMEANIFIFA